MRSSSASDASSPARPSRPVEAAAAGGGLVVRDLRVRVASGRVVLDVSALDIARDEFVVLAGPSGAGKSTLLFTLAGLQVPGTGSIHWGDTDIATLGEAARARFRAERVGMVFQDFLLFDELSALDNAALSAAWGAPDASATVRRRAAELLGWLGLDTADARPVSTLSGGERQRVAVARALATDPRIVLADEPTASLDREAADRLIVTLRRIVDERRRTVVVVSHDPALIASADRVVRLVDGRPCDAAP